MTLLPAVSQCHQVSFVHPVGIRCWRTVPIPVVLNGGVEPRKRAHSPQLAAGLASVSENGNFLTVEDPCSLLQGSSIVFAFKKTED